MMQGKAVLAPIDRNRAVQVPHVDLTGDKSAKSNTVQPRIQKERVQQLPELLEPYDILQLKSLNDAEKAKYKDQCAALWVRIQSSRKTTQDYIMAHEQLAKLSKKLKDQESFHKANPQAPKVAAVQAKPKYPEHLSHLLTPQDIMSLKKVDGNERLLKSSRAEVLWNQLRTQSQVSHFYTSALKELTEITEELKRAPAVRYLL
jgi:predicted metalloendopeptidase